MKTHWCIKEETETEMEKDNIKGAQVFSKNITLTLTWPRLYMLSST